MPYVKRTWYDAPSTASPINADALNNLETQYDQAMADVGALLTSKADLVSGKVPSSQIPAITVAPSDVGVAATGTRIPVSSSTSAWSAGVLMAQAATASSIVQRDSSGRITIVTGTSATQATTKAYVDAMSRSGTYAARPTAATAGAGVMYAATDVPEMYLSNGTSWQVVGSGGNELGAAQITASQSTTGGSKVDVPGMAVTFVAGERPVWMQLDADIKSSVTGAVVVAYLVLDNVVVQAGSGFGTSFTTMSKGVRKTFTPGTTHTVRIQMDGGGTLTMLGGTDTPSTLLVRTL